MLSGSFLGLPRLSESVFMIHKGYLQTGISTGSQMYISWYVSHEISDTFHDDMAKIKPFNVISRFMIVIYFINIPVFLIDRCRQKKLKCRQNFFVDQFF